LALSPERVVRGDPSGLTKISRLPMNGHRTIEIDDGLIDMLRSEREKHLRLVAGIPDQVAVDLSLIKLPDGA
jgi:hypothetical protein